ncbi:hypothetical protein V5O48_003701 [Marasmius crinis-equi]|uniref:Uncharacterized protein n=1 Tax=Marasmius crinis-equi TaxID=585013 RepID=A0ABR3FS46_9AGAR
MVTSERDHDSHPSRPSAGFNELPVLNGPSQSFSYTVTCESDPFATPGRRDSWPLSNLSVTTDPDLKAAENDLKRALSIYSLETSSMYSLASATPEFHDRYLPRRTLSRATSLKSYITYAHSGYETEGVARGATASGAEGDLSHSRQLRAGMPLPAPPLPAHLRSNGSIRPLPRPPIAKRGCAPLQPVDE